MDTLVVIPTRNEADSIGSFLQSVAQLHPREHTLVMDDSTDNTPDIVRSLSVECVHFPQRLGLGGSLRYAMKEAYKRNYCFIVVIDAGGSQNPEMIQRLIDTARSTEAGVVVADRFVEMPLPRVLVSWFASWMYRWLGLRDIDVTTSFRCYRITRELLQALGESEAGGFDFQPEILTLLARYGVTMMQVPTTYRITTSSFRSKFLWQGLRTWAKLLWRGLVR